MKKLAPLFVFLLSCLFSQAQVGINTTTPTSTLDVNGSIRLRQAEKERGPENIIATKIVGMDDLGNLVEVYVDENLVLENNTIRAKNNISRIGDVATIGVVIDDMNLIIWPGEPNEDKEVIRVTSLIGDVIMTGLVAGQDGQTIWLYPVSGRITFVPNSLLSLLGNRIETNGNMVVEQYEMVKLLYDGARSKWIIMDR